jgi:hypothetical protein
MGLKTIKQRISTEAPPKESLEEGQMTKDYKDYELTAYLLGEPTTSAAAP